MAKQIIFVNRKTGVACVRNITQAAKRIGMSRTILSRKVKNANKEDIVSNTFYHGNYKVILQVK